MKAIYETERLFLRLVDKSFAEEVLDYFIRNKGFLKEWEPVKDERFYTIDFQREQLHREFENIITGGSFKLWIFNKENRGRAIGSIGFNNIVRGAFLSCHLGYRLDKDEVNKGYITEAVRAGIEIMFREYGLHRVEANIMPRNGASLRVVEKLGFENEGLGKKYLRINGKWEDHIHMVLFNEEIE